MPRKKRENASKIYQDILNGKKTTFELEFQKSSYYVKKMDKKYVPSPLTTEEGCAWEYQGKYFYREYVWELERLFNLF